MNYQWLPVVCSVILGLSAPIAYGQDMMGPIPKKARTAADYQPRTLQEILKIGEGEQTPCDQQDARVVSGNILPSRVRVTYSGSLRPMPTGKRQVLHAWAQRYAGVPEGYTQPYQREILFQEGQTGYWLAVKQKDISQLQQALRTGESVDLNVIRMGGTQEETGWEEVLLVESFQTPERF